MKVSGVFTRHGLALFCSAILAGLSMQAAHADYVVTATMPATVGATSCQLYQDGAPLGSAVDCDAPVDFPVSGPGVYSFAYKAVNAFGESELSPAIEVAIAVRPEDPSGVPQITVSCADANGDKVACPANVVITIAP